MSKDDRVITQGPFKGKRITFASTQRTEEFKQIASEFMQQIFDLRPEDYAISDESDLRDFTEFGSSDTAPVWKRVSAVYGFDFADVGSGRLLNIFTEITRRRNQQ
jgi:hypothetical protein